MKKLSTPYKVIISNNDALLVPILGFFFSNFSLLERIELKSYQHRTKKVINTLTERCKGVFFLPSSYRENKTY